MKLVVMLFATTLAAPITLYVDQGACDAGCPDAGFELTRWARQWRLEPQWTAKTHPCGHCADAGYQFAHVKCDGGGIDEDVNAIEVGIFNPATCAVHDAGMKSVVNCDQVCRDPLPPVRVPVDHYECWRDAGWSDCP